MRQPDKFLIIGLVVILFVGIYFILIPVIYDLDVKTVTKVSDIYDEPITMTIRWITSDEIQVGKLTTIQFKIEDLPYHEKMELNDIVINFESSQLNYWVDDWAELKSLIDYEAKRQVVFEMKDSVRLVQTQNSTFTSEFFNVRFVIPENVSIEYCDYNLDEPCHPIENIIHPAPYDIDSRIQGIRTVIAMSLVTAGLSSIVVWNTFRKES